MLVSEALARPTVAGKQPYDLCFDRQGIAALPISTGYDEEGKVSCLSHTGMS